MTGDPRGGRRKGTPRRSRQSSGQRGSTQRRPHSETRPKGLGGGQIEGRHAVRELLVAGARPTREIILAAGQTSAPILDDIVDLADENHVTIREVSRHKFTSMAHSDAPQGVIAFAAPLKDYGFEGLFEGLSDDAAPPFLVLLDGIMDPGNLGAILRSAECAGVTGVLLPRHRATMVTAAAAKAAAGAVEHLRLATISGLPKALGRLSQLGIWSVGLDATAQDDIHDVVVLDGPVALVLGAEGKGLSRLVRERCDTVAYIPLGGVLSSMNVSAAAAVALFEVARHRSTRT